MTKEELLAERAKVCDPINKELWECLERAIPTPRTEENVTRALISLSHATSHVFMDAMDNLGSCGTKLIDSYKEALGTQLQYLLQPATGEEDSP